MKHCFSRKLEKLNTKSFHFKHGMMGGGTRFFSLVSRFDTCGAKKNNLALFFNYFLCFGCGCGYKYPYSLYRA